jgi:hypothetical protein
VSLYGELSRYRKRNRRSLDGAVAGLDWNRYHGGHRSAEAPVAIPTADATCRTTKPCRKRVRPAPWIHGGSRTGVRTGHAEPSGPAQHRLRPSDSSRTNRRWSSLVPDHVFIEMYDAAAAERRAAPQEAQSELCRLLTIQGIPEHAFDAQDANSGMHAMPDGSFPLRRPDGFVEWTIRWGSDDTPNSPTFLRSQWRKRRRSSMSRWRCLACRKTPRSSPGALDQPMYDPQMMQMLNPWMVPGMGPMM